jgi:glycerol-3-phosphate dehydrogenase
MVVQFRIVVWCVKGFNAKKAERLFEMLTFIMYISGYRVAYVSGAISAPYCASAFLVCRMEKKLR